MPGVRSSSFRAANQDPARRKPTSVGEWRAPQSGNTSACQSRGRRAVDPVRLEGPGQVFLVPLPRSHHQHVERLARSPAIPADLVATSADVFTPGRGRRSSAPGRWGNEEDLTPEKAARSRSTLATAGIPGPHRRPTGSRSSRSRRRKRRRTRRSLSQAGCAIWAPSARTATKPSMSRPDP